MVKATQTHISFEDYLFDEDLNQVRFALAFSAVLYGLFAVVDLFFYHEYISLFHPIRFIIIIPVLVLTLVTSYTCLFKKIHQELLLLCYLVAGLGIIVMIILIEERNFYTGGMFLIFSVAFFLLRLKSRYIVIGTVILYLAFILLEIFYGHLEIDQFVVTNIFYLCFIVLGMSGAIRINSFRRLQYLNEVGILSEKNSLEKQVIEQFEDLKHYHSTSIIAIAKLVELRDNYTAGHIQRVGDLAEMLAKAIPERLYNQNNRGKLDFTNSIKLSSTLHDIGKILVSDTILNKKGKLTVEEFEIMKTHTTRGFDILKELKKDLRDNNFLELGINIALSHHEHFDGNGYPQGLSGKNIPLEARVLAIIDVYDALSNKRSYKEAWSKAECLSYIRKGIGSQFDPDIAEIFIAIAEASNDTYLFGK